jgi:RNA polymerase sigma-70 factor (ECF subfamily)
MKRDDGIEQAIERVRAGDTAAYRLVVRAYQHEIWRVAAYALGTRLETEDLAQQAFVVAYQRIDRFERGRDFGAWLRGIARNLVRDQVRKKAREDQRMRRYLAYLEASVPKDDADAREAEMRRALAACREELPDAAREALALRYDEGHDFSRVAEAIGRTVAGARQLLQRTRLQLRQCIEGRLA